MKKAVASVIAIGIVVAGAWGFTVASNKPVDEPFRFVIKSESVEEMSAKSPIILQGTVVKKLQSWNLARNADDFSKEADVVMPGTDFEVAVNEYIRGEGAKSIVVTVPGGSFKGVSEEIRDGITTGKNYVLFLNPIPEVDKYILATAPGSFEIRGVQGIAPKSIHGHAYGIADLPLASLKERVSKAPFVVPMPDTAPASKSALPPVPGEPELKQSR